MKFKKLISALITGALTATSLTCVMPNIISENIEASSFIKIGDDLDWNFDADTNILEIKGSGMMCDFSYAYRPPWYSKCDQIQEVILPEQLTEIGDYAFSECSISSIEIPDSVTRIGECAFSETDMIKNQPAVKYADDWVVDCNKDIETATIRNGTIGISDYAFGNCSIEEVSLPDSLLYIGECGLGYCRIKSIDIPDSVKIIGYGTFWGDALLKTVRLPDVTSIGDNAFNECTSLESIVIPDSVTKIGNHAFAYCDKLKSVTFGNGLFINYPKNQSYDYYYSYNDVFEKCNSLDEIHIYDLDAFCRQGLGSIIPNAYDLFIGNEKIEHLIIPDTVSKIEKYAFRNCKSIKSITFPNRINIIDDYAFCFSDKSYYFKFYVDIDKSIESISIPESVMNIGNGIFTNCYHLNTVTIGNPKCQFKDDSIGMNKGQHKKMATIYAAQNSTAQEYAEKYNYDFKPITSVSISEPIDHLQGDSNGDGKLNVRDAAFIAAKLAQGKAKELPPEADFNGDNKVNVRDAAAIAKYLATGKK